MEASSSPHEQSPVTFRDPPVIEVALSIQFEGAVTHAAQTLGEFWPRIRDEFPGLQEQPALPPQREEFGVVGGGPQLEVMMQAPPPRYWFVSSDDTRLLQVQPDRLIYNWRKREEGQAYPRYRELRPEFERYLQLFLDVLTPEQRGGARPDWSEVTYVNHVVPGPGEETRPPLHEVLTTVLEPPPLAPGVELEETQLTERYLLIHGKSTAPSGRLHLTAIPATRNADRVPLHVITLVARGQAGGSVEGALAFLDEGREQLVTTFRDLTTETMHRRWGLES